MPRQGIGSRLERLEYLKARLKSADALTLSILAEETKTSLRTISRDLQILKEQGLPIESDRGRGGGVRLHHNYGVGRIQLQSVEAVDLLIGLAVAEQTRSPLFMTHLDSIRSKVRASLPREMAKKVDRLKARILVGQVSFGKILATYQKPEAEFTKLLYEAFLNYQSLQIEYLDIQERKTQRTIQPHYLLLCSPIWYILAWDELRAEVRTFRHDRIRAMSLAEATFELLPRDRFDQALEGVDTI